VLEAPIPFARADEPVLNHEAMRECEQQSEARRGHRATDPIGRRHEDATPRAAFHLGAVVPSADARDHAQPPGACERALRDLGCEQQQRVEVLDVARVDLRAVVWQEPPLDATGLVKLGERAQLEASVGRTQVA
jgi:hypothetical protein